jgi:hypothetical protein
MKAGKGKSKIMVYWCTKIKVEIVSVTKHYYHPGKQYQQKRKTVSAKSLTGTKSKDPKAIPLFM